MALKGLIAPKSALTEDAIESIIADFVRYDADEKGIAFTPNAARLSTKAKVLIYLVALQGWPFVIDETVPMDAKPRQIQEQVGVPGGTLRPILKDLKDRHFLAVKSGAYSVRTASLAAIKAEIDGSSRVPAAASRRVAKKRPKSASTSAGNGAAPKARRKPSADKSPNFSAQFNEWIDGGFFDQPRTLADVHQRFRRDGINMARTSVPRYLLKALWAKRLSREEAVIEGKKVWIYRTKK